MLFKLRETWEQHGTHQISANLAVQSAWLTKSQIQSFVSRLVASRRKRTVGISVRQQEYVECLVEDSERQELMQKITDEVVLKHPITCDLYDLCEFYQQNKPQSSFMNKWLKIFFSS